MARAMATMDFAAAGRPADASLGVDAAAHAVEGRGAVARAWVQEIGRHGAETR